MNSIGLLPDLHLWHGAECIELLNKVFRPLVLPFILQSHCTQDSISLLAISKTSQSNTNDKQYLCRWCAVHWNVAIVMLLDREELFRFPIDRKCQTCLLVSLFFRSLYHSCKGLIPFSRWNMHLIRTNFNTIFICLFSDSFQATQFNFPGWM